MCLSLLRRNTDFAIIIIGISIFTELGRECRGEIIFPPSNKVVLEGQEVLMECRTNNSATIIVWKKIENSSTQSTSVFIFTGTRIAQNVSHIYSINKTTGREYDLSMHASMAVAGKYICEAAGGIGFSAELIVLVTNPMCVVKTQGNYNYTLECSLRFNGNWFPEMEWEEEYYNKTRSESHVTRMTANTVDSYKLLMSTMTVAREEFQRNFTCKTRFQSTRLPHATTAKNIPSYENKCIVSVRSLQQISTAGFSKLDKSTEVMTLSSTAVYTDNYQIPLVIVYVILSVVLVLLIFILCKRKYRGMLFVRQSRETETHSRNMEPIHNDISQSQPNATPRVQRPSGYVDVIKDATFNSRCTSDDVVEYMEVNGFREQPVQLSPTHPSRHEPVIYAAIDHTNPPPRPPKATSN